MRGSVVKRGSTWSVVYDERTEDGTRKQRWRGGYPTRRDAQAALTEILGNIGAGTYVRPAKTTVGEHLEHWLTTLGDLRPMTLDT